MVRVLFLAFSLLCGLLTPQAAVAETRALNNAETALVMAIRARFAVQINADAAFELFKQGQQGFRIGDIYPFCFGLSSGILTTGQNTANPTDIRTLVTGSHRWGQEIFDAASSKPDGEILVVSYNAPKPLPNPDRSAVPKVSYVMAVTKEYGCGVGYYPDPPPGEPFDE